MAVIADVVIAGPASPKQLSRWLSESHRRRAEELPGLGGSPVNNLVHSLIEEGASVDVVTLAPEVDDREVLTGPKLQIFVGPYRPAARARARDLFRSEREHVRDLLELSIAPVVHAHWTYEFALGALASGGRPTIVHACDAPLTIFRHMPDRYRAARLALALKARMTLSILSAPSPYLARTWRHQMLYRRDVAILPNVIFPARRIVGCVPRDPDDEGPIILDVSDGGRLKNAAGLINAMKLVLEVHPDARCRLVGPELTKESHFARFARQIGIEEAVEFVGPVGWERLACEYSKATVFVHPSLEESFGMSVAEAMSYGNAVVAGSNAGAMPWILAGGDAGMLVDVRKPPAVADAICSLLASAPRREELAKKAQQRISHFAPNVVAPLALELYQAVQGM